MGLQEKSSWVDLWPPFSSDSLLCFLSTVDASASGSVETSATQAQQAEQQEQSQEQVG